MHKLRLFLPVLIIAMSAAPAFAGWVDDTVNNSIESIGRATLSPEALGRNPDLKVDSLASPIATGATITPQAAHDLLGELRALDRDRLETVAANVSTCVLVDCRGIPGDKVATLADRILLALRNDDDQRQNLWTRGVAILSVLVALLSVIVNVALNIATRRREQAAAPPITTATSSATQTPISPGP